MTKNHTRLILVSCLLVGIAAVSGACTVTDDQTDMVRVTSSSSEFKAAARGMQEPCNNPAEFGRCGCYMDDLLTSCDLVARCLEVGFCKAVANSTNSTETTSSSPVFSGVAKALAPTCNNPAEFGRCECTMDGIATSCDVVNRCLDAGFCRAVSQ